MKNIETILTALNSTGNFFKYPIGNKELTIETRRLESEGKIIYNALESKWYKRENKLSKGLKQ
jgi:hypothetical protein